MKNLLLLYLTISLFSSCFLTNIPTIESYSEMPSRKISAASNKLELEEADETYSDIEIKRAFRKQSLTEFAVKSESNALLVIKDGELVFEHYAENYDAQKTHSSFSVAKSFLSALVGIAIEEGKIKSDSELVISYVGFLDSTEFKDMRIYHLLQMTSGIRFDEKKIFYTNNSKSILSEEKLSYPSGKKFEYWSKTYQLLGYVLQSAIAPKTISQYLEEQLWQPMGAQSDAGWTIEEETKIEKTFCCLQARAEDFVKFGMLYLNQGRLNGKQLISESWIKKSIAINETEGSKKKYNYGWWFFSDTSNDYLARGFRGQYIYVNQKEKTVIVRFGPDWAGILTAKWADVFRQVAEQL